MRSKKAIPHLTAEQQLVSALPFFSLQLVANHLGARDRSALALTHPVFAEYFRATRERCVARVADRQQLKQLSRDLEKQQALQDLTVIFLFDKPVLSDLSFLSTITTSVSLQFRGEHPARRSLAWLGSSQFSLLQRLTLAGENRKERRLNVSGELSVLSGLPSLSALKLVNLHSDRGLDKLTQLRSLHIVYPNHADDAPPTPTCPVCMTVHAPEWSPYLYRALSLENVYIGTYISSLPLLKTLSLDFNAQNDQLSFSSLKNHFLWTHGTLAGQTAFPSLENICMINTINFEEDYFPIPAAFQACFMTSGYGMWESSCYAIKRFNSFGDFPALKFWELETDHIHRESETLEDLAVQSKIDLFFISYKDRSCWAFCPVGCGKPAWLNSAKTEV